MDNVNHPSHYESSCSIECIDSMRACFGRDYVIIFCLLNAYKYLWRHKNKNGLEDLKKAAWYLDKAGELDVDEVYHFKINSITSVLIDYSIKLD